MPEQVLQPETDTLIGDEHNMSVKKLTYIILKCKYTPLYACIDMSTLTL